MIMGSKKVPSKRGSSTGIIHVKMQVLMRETVMAGVLEWMNGGETCVVGALCWDDI